MPSSRPKARSARLSRSSSASTSIVGTGGSGGGTKARTVSPATGVSINWPRRLLTSESLMLHYCVQLLFKQQGFGLNNMKVKISGLN